MTAKVKTMKSKFTLGASAAAITWAVATAAMALPQNPVIFDSSAGGGPGAATFIPSTGTLTIDQNHDRVVIDWSSFNIAAGESVVFQQDAANWIALNRVDPSQFTTIDGSITATGSVWIFSPAGMLIGSNANINVGSFIGGLGLFQDGEASAMAGGAESFGLGLAQSVNTSTLEIAAGATVTTDTFLVLQGLNLEIDGDLTAGTGASFLISEAGGINFDSSSPSGLGIVNSFTGHDPSGRGQPNFTHSGTLTAQFVEINALGIFEANYQGVINLDGVINTTGANPANGFGLMVQTGPTNQPSANGGTLEVQVGGDITVVGGNAQFHTYDLHFESGSTLSVDGELRAWAYDEMIVSGDIAGTGDVILHVLGLDGTAILDGSLTSGTLAEIGALGAGNSHTFMYGVMTSDGGATVTSGGSVTITGTVTSDADLDGNGNVWIASGHAWDPINNVSVVGAGDIVIDSTAVIDGGEAEVIANAWNGDVLVAGSLTGEQIFLNIGVGEGLLDVSGSLTADNGIGLFINPDAIGGVVNVSGQIEGGGNIGIWSQGSGGELLISGDVESTGGYVRAGTGGENGSTSVTGTLTGATGVGVFAHGDGGTTFVDGVLVSDSYVFVSSDSQTTIGSEAVIIADADENDSGNALIWAGVVYDYDALCMCTGTAGDLVIEEGSLIAGGGSVGVNLYAYNGSISLDGTVYSDVAVLISTGGPSAGSINISGEILAQDFIRIYSDTADIFFSGDAVVQSDIDGENSTLQSTRDGVFVLTETGTITTEAGSVISAGPTGSPTELVYMEAGGFDGSGFLSAAIDLSGDIYGQDVVLVATQASVRVRDGASIVADDYINIVAERYFVLEEGGLLSAGENPTEPREELDWPYAEVDGNFSIAIRAADMAIYGEVTAPDGIAILIDGDYGYAYLGGEGGGANVDGFDLGSQFFLSDAEFQNLNAPTIMVLAGSDGGTAVIESDSDLTVRDLTINSDVVETLVLGTAADNSIFITGAVTVSEPGGTDLWIGGVANNPNGLVSFIPGNIAITGSIGSAENPFGMVTLIAHGDVGMGSEEFLEEAYYNEDFDALEQSGDFDIEEGHIFIAADSLSIAAGGRVIQQNTSGSTTEFSGLLIGAPTEERPLIFAPDELEGLEIDGGETGEDFTLSFTAGPEDVQLFGAFTREGPSGQPEVISGPDAANIEFFFDADITEPAPGFVNGCEVGGTCAGTIQPPRFETPTLVAVQAVEDTDGSDRDDSDDDGGDGESADNTFARSLIAPGSDRAYEQERMGEPITGSGNEDLWIGGGNGAE